MLRVLSAFALLVFAMSSAHAATYNDPQGRFSILVPDGWMSDRPEDSTLLAFVMAKNKEVKGGGVCLVIAKSIPESAGVKQSELNEALGQVVNREFWETAFKAAGGTDVTIEDTGTKDYDGRRTFYVVATQSKDGFTARAKQVLHPIPGALQFVTCAAEASKYAENEKEFETIFDSFVPKSGDYIAKAPVTPPSVLTLYTGAKFDGTARVLAQDTPNVALLGASPSSVAIAGYGNWEVCEGANYTGACQVVASGTSSESGRALRVGSVRRFIGDTKKVTGLGGVISATAGVVARDALNRAR